MSESDEPVVVPTQCLVWSLNVDAATSNRFWWNATYSISCWEDTLKIAEPVAAVTDDDVWTKYIDFQLHSVYKMCSVCRAPEGNEDLVVCCYCGSCVHLGCSLPADADQIAWKPANKSFTEHMRVCFACGDVAKDKWKDAPSKREPDNVRRAAKRVLSLRDELNDTLLKKVRTVLSASEKPHDEAKLMTTLQSTIELFFQPHGSKSLTTKQSIPSKAGGTGVVAAVDIPAFTVIGVYPGYVDALSGEQAKQGRPMPIYALMDLNCADFYNDVFVEFAGTVTPFINEPCPSEKANCAWIQQLQHREGRLSIITVCDIKRGDELLIGYGPIYPRSYPYTYDAYAFHKLESYDDPACFSLWHWRSLDEKDADFVCYIGYNNETDSYSYWETQDEFDTRH